MVGCVDWGGESDCICLPQVENLERELDELRYEKETFASDLKALEEKDNKLNEDYNEQKKAHLTLETEKVGC